MPLKQRLEQRQVQKLILTPALQQAIKLLPLTNLELVEVIDEELSENPMIEMESEADDAPPPDRTEESEQVDRPEADVMEGLTPPEGEATPETQDETGYGASFQEYLDEGFRPHFRETRDVVSIENTLSRAPSLWDHLDWQAGLAFSDPEDRELAAFIIGNVTEDGYLTTSEEETARLSRTTPERVATLRRVIRTFDPVGSASLDLREALLAQLDSLGVGEGLVRTIVERHLELLEKSDFAHLARSLNVPLAEVREPVDFIRSLDPAPGRKYTGERAEAVMPDIIVTKEGDEWKVVLNDEGLPRLRISPYYKRLLAQAAQGQPEAQRFLKDRLKKALWFLRSVDQRNQTIARVARAIVERQREFLDKGLDFIRPLTLVEIAQVVGVHESTVGRVVANKHMETPRGVFSLKYFFHKSLSGDFGEDVSSLRVKARIRKLVENEDRNRPLSDIEIGELLARENLRIARRTVTKYRMLLRILPSHIRKRKSLMEGGA